MNWNATTRHPLSATMDILPAPRGLSDRIQRILFSTAPPSTLLIRAIVGSVFLLEGNLKFLEPEALGVGRFVKIGIPFPSFFAPFVGFFEIGCGIALILGFLTRVSAMPMIVNMVVAIATTKIPILLRDGFWKAAHEARLDVTMLLGCVFLLLVGAGPLSLDSLFLTAHQGGRLGFKPRQSEYWS